MCRSIRTLRPPQSERVTTGDVQAAARQYVRKVSGFREPSEVNKDVFTDAIARIADVTAELLESLDVRGIDAIEVVDGPEADLRRRRAQPS